MDLIYCDKNFIDVGVVDFRSMDIAYGEDENNFELVVDSETTIVEMRGYVYAEGTEYGGKIESRKVDTENNTITFGGRTWHGILDSYKPMPKRKDAEISVGGTRPNAMIAAILTREKLTSLFRAREDEADTDFPNEGVIPPTPWPKHEGIYTGLRRVLTDNDYKLKMAWTGDHVELWAEPVHNYAIDEEFDSSLVNFNVSEDQRAINHLICLGSGEGGARRRYDLFCTRRGAVFKDYLKPGVFKPIKDTDYVHDLSQRRRDTTLTPVEEICEIIEADDTTVENFVRVTDQPTTWRKYYTNYYSGEYVKVQDEVIEDEEVIQEEIWEWQYEPFTEEFKDVFRKLPEEPDDWATGFDKYFYRQSGEYKTVEAESQPTPVRDKPSNWSTTYEEYYHHVDNKLVKYEKECTSTPKQLGRTQPNDWAKNYDNYYIYEDNQYKAVSGQSYTVYVLTDARPSTWATSYADHFRLKTEAEKEKIRWIIKHDTSQTPEEKQKLKKELNNKYISAAVNPYFVDGVSVHAEHGVMHWVNYGTAPTWKKNTFYFTESRNKAPKYDPQVDYYRIVEEQKVPDFIGGDTYIYANAAPSFSSKTFYYQTQARDIPVFSDYNVFRRYEDHYAELIRQGIEYIEAQRIPTTFSMSISDTAEVDVDDIVGFEDHVTTTSDVQRVSKKIIKIESHDTTIQYEVTEK